MAGEYTLLTGDTESWGTQGTYFYGSLRVHYEVVYYPESNQSYVIMTPQFWTNANIGNDNRFFNASGSSSAGIYGNGNKLYEFSTNYGSGNYMACGNAENSWTSLSGSVGMVIQHDNNGDASFTTAIYCSVIALGYQIPGGKFATLRDFGNTTSNTITAHANAPFTLTYNANGGSGGPANQGVYVGISYTIPNTAPTRTGYTFKGWAESSTATTAQYVAGNSITPNGNKTLYAVWQINSYTITCSDRIGSSSGTQLGTKTASYIYGSSVSGASFGSSTAYDAYYTGYHYTGSSSTITVTGAATVYRYFAPNTWTVAYNANGGSSTPASQTKTYGVNLTLASAIARANASAGSYTVTYNYNGSGKSDTTDSAARTTSYTFTKWNTAQNGSGTNYNAGATYSANTGVTMYAQWTSTTTTGAVLLPSATRTGRTFNGWYTAASGGTKVGNAGANYTPSGNVTLYAHWTINTFTFTAAAGADIASVSLNGTSSTTSVTKTVNYGSSNTFVATMGSNVAFNYTFGGWYNGSTRVSQSLTYTAPAATGALSLTAKASKTAKSYTLSFTKPNTGGSAEVRRTSSPNGGGNIGSLNDGATIYYGDVLQVSYTENPGYEVDAHTINGSTFTSPATITVTGNVTVVVSMKNAGVVWIWTGSSWEKYIPMIWNGSSWERYIPMIWTGSAWEIY